MERRSLWEVRLHADDGVLCVVAMTAEEAVDRRRRRFIEDWAKDHPCGQDWNALLEVNRTRYLSVHSVARLRWIDIE